MTTNPIPPIETADDLLDDLVAYEQGLFDEDASIGFFQRLIDTGLVWSLQGNYGRVATILIERGACTDPRPVRQPRHDLVGTRCECGAPYDVTLPGYSCAR